MPNVSASSIQGTPLLVPQTRLIEETNSFTVGGTTTPPGLGSGTSLYRITTRQGRYAKIRWEIRQTAAGTAGSGAYTLSLPSGIVIDTTKQAVSGFGLGPSRCGEAYIIANSFYTQGIAYARSNNTIAVVVDNQGTAGTSYTDWGSGALTFLNAALSATIEIEIPVVGWEADEVLSQGTGINANSASLVPNFVQGSFTPGLYGSGVNPTVTYFNQFGRYTKIGNRVDFMINIVTSAVGGSPTGNILVGPLPFTSASGASNYQAVSLAYSTGYNTQNPVGALIIPNSVYMALYYRSQTAPSGSVVMPVGYFGNNSEVDISGTYYIA